MMIGAVIARTNTTWTAATASAAIAGGTSERADRPAAAGDAAPGSGARGRPEATEGGSGARTSAPKATGFAPRRAAGEASGRRRPAAYDCPRAGAGRHSRVPGGDPARHLGGGAARSAPAAPA